MSSLSTGKKDPADLEAPCETRPNPESLEASRLEAITAWRTATSEQARAIAYSQIAHCDHLLGRENYNGRH